MSTFVLAFAGFVIFFGFLAVGYIFQRKRIQGSCGGIAALGLDKVCDCPEPCERRKKAMRKEEERRRRMSE